LDKVTILVVNYNGRKDLEECLASVEAAVSPDDEVMVIDNASSDGSADFIRQRFPRVRLIEMDRNHGHSHACNVGLEKATADYVLIMDYDTVVGKVWLSPLVESMRRDPGAGICVSRAIFYPEKEVIHSDGGWAHYVGNMTLKNGFSSLEGASSHSEEVGAAGSTSMLVDRKKALEIGGFDKDYFVYLNDFEFSLRMRLAGYRCLSCPQSIIYHKGGNPAVSYRGSGQYPRLRAFYIFRNRWFTILKIYSPKTIILCLPALAVYELAIIGMASTRGLLLTYLKALFSVIKSLPAIYEKRKPVQAMRKIPDSELLTSHPLSFVPGSVGKGMQVRLLGLLNILFIAYWKVVRAVL